MRMSKYDYCRGFGLVLTIYRLDIGVVTFGSMMRFRGFTFQKAMNFWRLY